MHYSKELIDEIKQKSDIVDVISSCVKLTRKGSNYFGLCPFHDEKTGSFSVTPRKQMFYCFGCHEGGNVISFIQKYEKMTFPEAIRFLAERAGIELPEFDDAGARERRLLQSKLLEINKETATYYCEKLWAGSEYWTELHFLLQGIFLTQGLNPGLLHCQWILYQLSQHIGSICPLVFQSSSRGQHLPRKEKAKKPGKCSFLL